MKQKYTIPKPASTIMLLRKNPLNQNDLEVLMIKRHKNLKFLGGFYSFPGGRVEEQDYSINSIKRIKGLTPDDSYKILFGKISNSNINLDEKYKLMGYWTAAIRELFEEIGILLLYNENNQLIKNYNDKFEQYRKMLIDNKIKFWEILNKENLYYAADKLNYFNRFITPKISPKRYDTRFFICILESNILDSIKININEKEISEFIWIKPSEALNRYKLNDPDFKIIFPQIVSLKELTKYEQNIM